MYYPGTILIWAAFLLGLASTVGFALAVRGEDDGWKRLARQAYGLMTLAVIVAAGLLMYLFITHDYRLFYVTAYSDNSLPLQFLISSFWAGQEGSFLLWIFWGVLLGLPLMRFARQYETRVMIFYNVTLLSLLMLLLKQDPFRFHRGLAAGMAPMDGQGLNPLLQNPWMVIHPPIMFLGYASLAIPFAFALAALWMRRYDEWTKASMPWVLVSFVTLGTAIMLGGYWAYETLGWGGYWGWDPVENASLVPWLATAALTHGILLQRGRQRFRRMNLVLAVLAYLLVVYGTFLTRSGVLADFSVHSFVDLGISGWLIFNMVFFLSLSVGMLVWRWREIPSEVGSEPFFSRTIFFVLGVLLLIGTGLMVLLGTSAPLITRLWTKPSQVGPDFYNRIGMPLAVAFGLILGIIPFLGWRKTASGAMGRALVVAPVTLGLTGLAVALGVRSPESVIYAAAVFFALAANLVMTWEKVRAKHWPAAGGAIAHVGLALMLLAFLTTGLYDSTQKVRLKEGTPTKVLGYTMTFRGVEKPNPAARDAMVVEVTDQRGGSFVLKPKMWVNQKTNQLVANPDIKAFLTRDLYLAPVEYSPGEEAPVSARLTLSKGEPAEFKDWKLTFTDFDLSHQSAVPGAVTVGAKVLLERPGQDPVSLVPSVVSTGQGVQAVPVEIPGRPGAQLRLRGMNASSGVVQVDLLGLGGGMARSATLHKGESFAYHGMKVTFSDFDLSDFDPQAGKINIGAVFQVEKDGQTVEVEPTYHGGGQAATPIITPATIPGSGGIALNLGRMDAEGGAVEVQVFDPNLPPRPPAPQSLVLDVSVKPLIGFVWGGTLLIIAGILMALMQRRRDVASIPVADE